MNSSVAEARDFFPTMPKEVFDGWLLERIATAGWPPYSPRWNALLGGYSPNEWKNFTWNKENLDIYNLTFSEDSISIIRGLAAARFGKANNNYTNIENSDSRMKAIHAYIEKTKKLPGSVVLIDGSPWEIVDGCHRITMYIGWLRNEALSNKINRMQSVWVARPSPC